MDTVIGWLTSIIGSDAFTQLLLQAFTVVVTGVVGVLAYQYRKRVLHEIAPTDLAVLRDLAAVAVQYVEQRFKDADGPAKLAEAVKAANVMIAGYGIKVTVEQLEAIIESAVYAETAHAPLPEVPLGT